MNDYDVSAALDQIERELIDDMMSKISKHIGDENAEGFDWSMWQAEQLKALEQYKIRNAKKYGTQFERINDAIADAIAEARKRGRMQQEIEILEALGNGFKPNGKANITGKFFGINERRVNALIDATVRDMQRAETACLRLANDRYRKIIFKAHMYASGGGTVKKAIDMADHDFLAAGINCVEYKNGARHTIRDYADMAIKTAEKRAYLAGEGEMRKEWGISTVIINKRNGGCPECARFCGKVFIDDVWSGGKKSDGKYPLLSGAIEMGLYHPRCKDSHSTYFPGLSTADDSWSKEELDELAKAEERAAKKQYAERRAEEYERLAKYSLDEDDKRMYAARAKQWEDRANNLTSPDIRSAERRAKELGIDADYTNFTPELADVVNESIAKVQERYGELKKLHGVKEHTGGRDAYAMFNKRTGFIELKNVSDSDIIESMDRVAHAQYSRGIWSTGDYHHSVVHEAGHALGLQYLNSEKHAAIESIRKAEVRRVTRSENTDLVAILKSKDAYTNPLVRQFGARAKEGLSLYALMSVDEMIAESVAQDVLGVPSDLAKKGDRNFKGVI